MPLDVLSKIQSFANGGSVDAGTKGAINQMIGDAQQNPALQSGLNGIANAVTNNGASINPDTMAQLAKAGQAFSKAMEQANLAMLGIHGSFNSIDVTPLEKAEASLTGIAEHGKGISVSIGTKDAELSLSSIANRIEKIRSSASIGVSVSTSIPRATSAPKPQKFATGGRITYHRQNTETAQTGGIFRHGSSTGDRNMIFANRGEGIITEKAVRQGARQRGMSPESYVQALNHPLTNLAMVKKGRSFSYGGLLTTGGYSNPAPEFNHLILYLTSDKFHGSERYGTPARRLQEIIDDYVSAMAPTAADFSGLDANSINRILTFAKNQETMYENDINERLSRIKDNSFNRARVVGTGTASRSIRNVVNDTNTGIASGAIPASGPMHTTASSRQSLKTSARTTASSIKAKYENLSAEKQTSRSGQMQKLVVDASSKISEFLKKATDKQIELIDSILNSNGVSGGIDDFRSTLEDLETHFDTLSRRTTQTVLGYSKLIDGIDFQGIEERMGWEASRLSAHKKRNIMTRFVSPSGYRDKQLELNGITTSGGNAGVRDELSSLVLRSIANETDHELADLKEKFLEQLESLSDSADFSKQKEIFNALNVRTEADFQDMLTNAERLNACVKMSEKLTPIFKRMQVMREKQAKHEIEAIRSAGIQDIENGTFTRSAVNGIWQKIDIDKYINDAFGRIEMTDKNRADMKDIAAGYANVKKSTKANILAQYGLEKEFGGGASLSNIMEELSKGNGVGGKSYDETLKGVLKVMKAVQPSSDSFKESASDVTDAWDKETDAVKKIIKQLPILGKLTDDQIAKHAAWIAGLSLIAKNIQKIGTIVADFVTKQADLSAGLTRASQMVDTFSGKANNFDGLRKSLNLTREQAVALGDAMSQVALKGVHSVDTVAGIAQNLKSALGKVDTTMLKEAVNLINDLPKEQVDVLITGTGTFDDKANLIANLMKDGNLEKSINLMMNGAFGDMEGSIQLDEKDKAVIAAQEEGNKLLDDIKQGLYSFVPKGFAAVSAKYAKMIGQLAQGVATVWTLYSISHNVGSIAMQMTGRGAGGGGGLTNAVKGAWANAHTTTGGPVNWKSFGSNLLNMKNPALARIGAIIGAYAGIKIVSFIADQLEKSADRKDKERASEYRQNAALNMSVYGTAAGRYKEEWNTEVAKRSAADAAKTAAVVAGTVAALGVALAPATLGLSALAGIAITAGAALQYGLISGIVAFVSEISSLKKIGNPYAHVEARDWWFDTVKEDANAKERKEGMERIYSDLERRFAEEHGVTVDEVKRDNLILKQMIQLNKHAKAIEMISKGRFTAFEEGTAQGNVSLMKKMTQFGGTNSDYMGASMRAFAMFSQAYAKSNKLMNERKMRIVKNEDNLLGDEEKANALNALLDEELKMHEKFINNMMNVIKAFGDLPQVIVHNLKAEMDNAFNNYMSGGFLGGRNIATINARENLKNGTQDMIDLFSANGRNNRMIRESAKFLHQRHGEYQAQLDAMQSETGISSDEEALKKRNEIRSRYDGEDGNLVDLVAGYYDLMDFANRIRSDQINVVGSDKEKIDGVVEQYASRVDDMIEILESQLNYAKDPDERKEIEAAINKFKDIQSKKMDNEQKWRNMNNAMMNIPTVLKHMKAQLDKIAPEDKKQIKNIQRFLSLSQAKASLQDPNVYAQKTRTEQSKQFVQKMEELSKRFRDSLESVLKNGAVQMADAIKGALEKSEEFDMFRNGNAVWGTISAGVDSAIEKYDAANKAPSLVQESFSMEDGSKFRKELEEGVQKYFEEIETSAKEQSGNEAEKFIADRVDNIYKLLAEEKKSKIMPEENRMFGAELRKIGFGMMHIDMLKGLGVKSEDELSKLSDEEIGRKISRFEKGLAKKYQSERGMSESDAKNRARQETEYGLSSYYFSGVINSGYQVDQERLAKVRKVFSERDSSMSRKMAGIDDELKPKLDELNKQKEEQIKANREETKKILNSTKEGREYLKLIFEQAELSNRLFMNPQNDEAKERLKEITEKISKFEKENFANLDGGVGVAIKAAATVAANSTKAYKEAMDAQANAKEEYMKVLKNIANAVDKAVQCGESLVMIAKTERLQTQQNFENEYGSVGKAIGMSGSILKATRDAKNAQMSRIPEARQRGIKEINRLYHEEMSRAKTEDERVAATRKRNWSIEKLETSLAQAQIRIHKEAVERIQQAYQPALDALDRYKEGANIMKDLFETMGAPFEYILDIENNLVAVAKAYAEQQMNILEEMKKNNVEGASLKKQELKTVRAQADAVKAMYGAQRNAIDKLLGSIMGSFTQLEGVFGPDSEFAKVWKVGQGYTQFPSGLIAASGGSNADWGSRLLEHLGTSPRQFHGQGFPFGEQFRGMMGFAEGVIANNIDDGTHRNQSAVYNGGRLNGLTNGNRNIVIANGNEARQNQRAGGVTSRYAGIRGEATISHNGRIMNTMSMHDVSNASDDYLRWFYGRDIGGARQVNPDRMRIEQQRAMASLGDHRTRGLKYNSATAQVQPANGTTDLSANAYGYGEETSKMAESSEHTNAILLKILKDTHSIAEVFGVSVDWSEVEKLENALRIIDDSVKRVADSVRASINDQERTKYFNDRINPAFAGKTTGELIEMRDSLVENSINNGMIGDKNVKRQIYDLNNAILYDRLIGSKKNPEGTGQGGKQEASKETSLSVDEEMLKYVKMIYLAIVGQVGSSLGQSANRQNKSTEVERKSVNENLNNENSKNFTIGNEAKSFDAIKGIAAIAGAGSSMIMAKSLELSDTQAIGLKNGKVMPQGNLVAQGYTQAENVAKWGFDLDARQKSLDAKKQELPAKEEAERKRQEERLRRMQFARRRIGGIPALTINAMEGNGRARHYVYENGRRKQIRNPEADKWVERQTQLHMAGVKQQLEQEQKAIDKERELREIILASINVGQNAKDAVATESDGTGISNKPKPASESAKDAMRDSTKAKGRDVVKGMPESVYPLIKKDESVLGYLKRIYELLATVSGAHGVAVEDVKNEQLKEKPQDYAKDMDESNAVQKKQLSEYGKSTGNIALDIVNDALNEEIAQMPKTLKSDRDGGKVVGSSVYGNGAWHASKEVDSLMIDSIRMNQLIVDKIVASELIINGWSDKNNEYNGGDALKKNDVLSEVNSFSNVVKTNDDIDKALYLNVRELQASFDTVDNSFGMVPIKGVEAVEEDIYNPIDSIRPAMLGKMPLVNNEISGMEASVPSSFGGSYLTPEINGKVIVEVKVHFDSEMFREETKKAIIELKKGNDTEAMQAINGIVNLANSKPNGKP